MEPKKKQVRPNKTQIRLLLEYMRDHPNFAAGKFSASLGEGKLMQEWAGLKDLLNEQGPARSVEQWKVTWRDQKVKARKEGGEHHRALNETGNKPVPELSESSALVLDTIGVEMAVGLGRAESSIGFSPPDVQVQVPVQAGSSGSQMVSPPPVPQQVPQDQAGSSSGSETQNKRKKKALMPPERFLNAQLDKNRITQTQLQSLNETMALMNTTLVRIQRELEESNRLRTLQIQGQGMDRQVIEVSEVSEQEMEKYLNP